MVATSENLSHQKLPPGERDFDLYRAVAFENQSTRAVATQYGISQTRVRQVMAKVVAYFCETVPTDLPKISKQQQLYAAEQLGRMQLDFLYGEAMRAWRHSQETPTLKGPNAGQVCYLNQAMKIALVLAKVPTHPLPEFRENDEGLGAGGSGLGEEQKPTRSVSEEAEQAAARSIVTQVIARAQKQKPSSNGNSPPVGDCSKPTIEQGPAAKSDPEAIAVDDQPAESCAELPERHATESAPTCAPAQNAAQTGSLSEAAAPQLRLRDQKLNRRERRARERMLQKSLARKKPK